MMRVGEEFDPLKEYQRQIGDADGKGAYIKNNTHIPPKQVQEWLGSVTKQPEIHIHIHIDGDKDPNELAKVVADSIKKNVQKGGLW